MQLHVAAEPAFQVVILAGGECKRLYPLTSGGKSHSSCRHSIRSAGPLGGRAHTLLSAKMGHSAGTFKALLPVGNRPLISYPLRNLEEAGIRECLVVRARAGWAEVVAMRLQHWQR